MKGMKVRSKSMKTLCPDSYKQLKAMNAMMQEMMPVSKMPSFCNGVGYIEHMLPHHEGAVVMLNKLESSKGYDKRFKKDDHRLLLNIRKAHEVEIAWLKMMLGKDKLALPHRKHIGQLCSRESTDSHCTCESQKISWTVQDTLMTDLKYLVKNHMTCNVYKDFLTLMSLHHDMATSSSAIILNAHDYEGASIDTIHAFAGHLYFSQKYEIRFMQERWEELSGLSRPRFGHVISSLFSNPLEIGQPRSFAELEYGTNKFGTPEDIAEYNTGSLAVIPGTRSGSYDSKDCSSSPDGQCTNMSWKDAEVAKYGKDGKRLSAIDTLIPEYLPWLLDDKASSMNDSKYSYPNNNNPFPNELLMVANFNTGTLMSVTELPATQHSEIHHTGWSTDKQTLVIPYPYSNGRVDMIDVTKITTENPSQKKRLTFCKLELNSDGVPITLNANEQLIGCAVPHTAHQSKNKMVELIVSVMGSPTFDGVGGAIAIKANLETMNVKLIKDEDLAQHGYDIYFNHNQGIAAVTEYGTPLSDHFGQTADGDACDADFSNTGKPMMEGMGPGSLACLLTQGIGSAGGVSGFTQGFDLFDWLSPLITLLTPALKDDLTEDMQLNHATYNGTFRGTLTKKYGDGLTMFKVDITNPTRPWKKIGRAKFGTFYDYGNFNNGTSALDYVAGGDGWNGPLPYMRGAVPLEIRAPHREWLAMPASDGFNTQLSTMLTCTKDDDQEDCDFKNIKGEDIIPNDEHTLLDSGAFKNDPGPSQADIRRSLIDASGDTTTMGMPLHCLATAGKPNLFNVWIPFTVTITLGSELQAIYIQDQTGAMCWRPATPRGDQPGFYALPGSCVSNIPNTNGRLDDLCVFSDAKPSKCKGKTMGSTLGLKFPRIPGKNCKHLFGVKSLVKTVDGENVDERDSIAVNLVPGLITDGFLLMNDASFVQAHWLSGEVRTFNYERYDGGGDATLPDFFNLHYSAQAVAGGFFQNVSKDIYPKSDSYDVIAATDKHFTPRTSRPKTYFENQCHPSKYEDANPCGITGALKDTRLSTYTVDASKTHDDLWADGISEVTMAPQMLQMWQGKINGVKKFFVVGSTSLLSTWDMQYYGAPAYEFHGNHGAIPDKHWGCLIRFEATLDSEGAISGLTFDSTWGFDISRAYLEAYNADTTGVLRKAGAHTLMSTLPAGLHEIRYANAPDSTTGGFA